MSQNTAADRSDTLVCNIDRAIQTHYSRAVHIVAIILFLMTFLLIAVGGNVTSLDAGLAVPDGWTTFGYPTPIAPPSVWWDNLGTRWEHGHRLVGNVVGILAITMVVMSYWKQRQRKWVPKLAVALLLMIIVQGTMGVYRVTEISTSLALIHGVFGQMILGACVLMVVGTSKLWISLVTQKEHTAQAVSTTISYLRIMCITLIVLLLLQLVLGASVRHTKSALAIPDFPAMYGGWIPPMSQEAINQTTAEWGVRPYEAYQVHLHFSHRLFAYGIFIYGLALFAILVKRARYQRELAAPAFAVMNLLLLQVALGISVVITGEYPLIATGHQATGAALLAASVWLTIRTFLVSSVEGASTLQSQPAQSAGTLQGGVA
ncbi:COX15/CtaA family protein [Poriferisphaera sp. WC338]|uniref:COX15/CtaA family protein n=1 Tax=Poriferisphaera sp. WC338 TaxID=3425129 RepID=UPI003D81B97D